MQREYIEIEKELIPYSFEIELGVELFEIGIEYNAIGDFFTLSLSKDGEVLVSNEKITYGEPLFSEIYDARYPAPLILPLDESNKETRVGWDNLNDTVFLVVMND
ncbi:hypothetical protein [Metasolibacillus sp.]|uniref:phage baseplate plug family protein n=1 Tax=Metasolibacillus sp. TaxID=2703680 RepID=UPI0025D60FC6|nr:hypothetical protein [Metasolibacillus sp.]MCT6926172.1 hypothetical protein [Metasolibacillus sp.]MCT6942395.1 hypothetical protein [Metasolibacillus sp.]